MRLGFNSVPLLNEKNVKGLDFFRSSSLCNRECDDVISMAVARINGYTMRFQLDFF